MNSEQLVNYLIQNGCSRKLIAEIIGTSYQNFRNYCRRNKLTARKMEGYERIKQHRQNKKILAILYKGGGCQICGYNKCITALEFHHRDPNAKDFTISRNLNLSWAKMKIELDKCDMLCANCHREVHYNQNLKSDLLL